MNQLDTCCTCRMHSRCGGIFKEHCTRYKAKRREYEYQDERKARMDAIARHYRPDTYRRIRGAQ